MANYDPNRDKIDDLIESARPPRLPPRTRLQRIDSVYVQLVELMADVARRPGTETALIASHLLESIRALADARALVILNGY
jgi:hypothetical protein